MKNTCNMCGHDNPTDNFRCENDECGCPLDLEIVYNQFGLPEIQTKKL
jgi:hypothetical protein